MSRYEVLMKGCAAGFLGIGVWRIERAITWHSIDNASTAGLLYSILDDDDNVFLY